MLFLQKRDKFFRFSTESNAVIVVFTCMQPKNEAKLNVDKPNDVRPRWWFNSVTGQCEGFMWDPWDETQVQSPNNFRTREHCESFCKESKLTQKFFQQVLDKLEQNFQRHRHLETFLY